ncbi:MAG: hypothetical protein J5I90_02715, partial [Caldilineales bacterium]|nr:hypothetical protein [Caldilineales bacterium]
VNQPSQPAEQDMDMPPAADDDALYAPPDAIVQDEEIEAYDLTSSDSMILTTILAIVVFALVIIAILLFGRSCNLAGGSSAPNPTTAPTTAPEALPETQATITPIVVPAPSTGESPLPEPTASVPIVTPDLPATGFQNGMRVVVAGTEGEGARFRSGPGTEYITVVILKDGDQLVVVGGPEQSDGFTWWRLQAQDGKIGWTIEDVLEPAGG